MMSVESKFHKIHIYLKHRIYLFDMHVRRIEIARTFLTAGKRYASHFPFWFFVHIYTCTVYSVHSVTY